MNATRTSANLGPGRSHDDRAQCTWPSGHCQHWAEWQCKPDPFGREWMHCESGLTMSKASLARFMTYCLQNHVEIGQIDALQPHYARSLVMASIRLHPDQFAAFERETGGKLRKPPVVNLNCGGLS